jgi:hypothetical protein
MKLYHIHNISQYVKSLSAAPLPETWQPGWEEIKFERKFLGGKEEILK